MHKDNSDPFAAAGEELLFLPLGGAGEIGMNLNLYGYGGKWLMVDLGVSFGDDTMPSVDVYMPDPAFIVERRDKLLGLVVTHGHEDHLGAVQYLWSKLRCPVYATPFAAAILKAKLQEVGLLGKVPLHVIPLSHRFQVGPFDIELISLTHSIPEPNALAIRTPGGTVLHTGDWKFDPDPLIGDSADLAALRRLGDEGTLAVVGDSTNVFVDSEPRSEAEVRDSLKELVGQYNGRIAVACFATNVARVESIARAALAHGRHVSLVGRSLWRIDQAARANGYFKGLPPFLSDHDGAYLPEDKVLYICTGSQGEPRAALPRIASGQHPHVSLGKGDVVIFSSRIIPGNEKAIGALQNKLVKKGCEIVTEKDHFVHVSGHPGRQELIQMYQLVRPKVVLPVHGEARHLMEHARVARECQVPHTVLAENGSMVRLSPGEAEIVANVPAGRLALDGSRLVPWDSAILKHRHRMNSTGVVVVTAVVDKKGKLLGDPQVSAPGLLDAGHEPEEMLAVVEAVREAVAEADHPRDDDSLKETIRLAIRRHLRESHGKKPLTDVHLVRV
jgi:ribonuclease J